MQFLRADLKLASIISSKVDAQTLRAFRAERALIATLKADCKSRVGVLATETAEGHLKLKARVLSEKGEEFIELVSYAPIGECESHEKQAKMLGEKLLAMGAARFL